MVSLKMEIFYFKTRMSLDISHSLDADLSLVFSTTPQEFRMHYSTQNFKTELELLSSVCCQGSEGVANKIKNIMFCTRRC